MMSFVPAKAKNVLQPKPVAVAPVQECSSYKSYQIAQSGDTINILDCKGRKQGFWVEQTLEGDIIEVPARAVGAYYNGKRVGNWIFYEGPEITSTIDYAAAHQDGQVRFYEEGKLACSGFYKTVSSSSTYDTFQVFNPATGTDTTVAVRAASGTIKNGIWTFYNTSTGEVAFTREYWLDELIEHKEAAQPAELSEEEKKKLEARLPHQSGRQFAPMQNPRKLPQTPTIKQLKGRL
jgi:hypothetical protein